MTASIKQLAVEAATKITDDDVAATLLVKQSDGKVRIVPVELSPRGTIQLMTEATWLLSAKML